MLLISSSIFAFLLSMFGILLYFRCWMVNAFVEKSSHRRLMHGGLLGIAFLITGGLIDVFIFSS